MKFTGAALASLLTSCLIAGTPLAQTYPAKPVRVLTPFPTGSGPDSALRLVGEKLAKTWRQQLVVDNRPGGNGFIAAEAARRATPDGYTFVQLDVSNLTVHPHLYRKLPYDPLRDFDAVAGILRTYFFIVVPADSQWRSETPSRFRGTFGIESGSSLSRHSRRASATCGQSNAPSPPIVRLPGNSLQKGATGGGRQ